MVGRDVCIIEALLLISRRRECLTFKRLLFLFLLAVLEVTAGACADGWPETTGTSANPTILNYSWTSTKLLDTLRLRTVLTLL